jgi:hypothetical protein
MTVPNNPSPTSVSPARKRCGRSRIANGKLHRRGVDPRSHAARRFKDAIDALCGEIGRPLAALTEVERTRVRMAAHFTVVAEESQARAASGRTTDVEQDVRVANTLARLLDDLGLSREGQEARRQQAEAAAIEERSRALGIPQFKR